MKTIYHFVKRIIMSIMLLFWFSVVSTLCITIGMLLLSPRTTLFLVRNVYCRGFFIIMGFTPTTSGLDSIDTSKTYVFASNHESHLDTQAIFISYPKYLHFIAKKELKYVPVIGWTIMAMGMLFIDRKNSAKAKESLAQAASLIRGGKNVISFPEGTRTKDGEIKRFKRGLFSIALEAGVDVVPVAMIGARKAMPSGSLRINAGPIHVAFGAPIARGLYANDPEGYANAVHEEVVKMKAHWTPRLVSLQP
jgi:1-acyl-sn-glycerol-3-phosphate acyltransferase